GESALLVDIRVGWRRWSHQRARAMARYRWGLKWHRRQNRHHRRRRRRRGIAGEPPSHEPFLESFTHGHHSGRPSSEGVPHERSAASGVPRHSRPSCCGARRNKTMRNRIVAAALLLVLIATPVNAQLAVIDPANLAQAILIVQRTQRHYEELVAQYRTILRMAQGLGRMDSYRTPPFALNSHDLARWSYGRPWIAALNSGDATGAAYLSTALPLAAPNAPASISASGRREFERRYATVEITDSVAMMGGHQVGLMRGYYGALQEAVQALERDVVNGSSSYHEMTAI